jgi:hypothetical protein
MEDTKLDKILSRLLNIEKSLKEVEDFVGLPFLKEQLRQSIRDEFLKPTRREIALKLLTELFADYEGKNGKRMY